MISADLPNFFPLRTKTEVKFIFVKFHHLVGRQFSLKLKCLQSDQWEEFKALISYLIDHGIQIRHSCVYVRQQNGKNERKHRHIVETSFTLLAHASMPLQHWWLTFETTVFLINRMPTLTLNHESSYKKLFKQ